MAHGRWPVIVAALAVTSGCAGAGPSGASLRPAHLDPWRAAGVTPTASSIEYALYEGAHDADVEQCPFHLATCMWRRSGAQPRARARLTVDRVRCTFVAGFQDRCTFRLTETIPGHDPVRSRCTGHFTPAGTSHDPARWEIDYYGRGSPITGPALVCRRGSIERYGEG
jgi:hypothetical protein